MINNAEAIWPWVMILSKFMFYSENSSAFTAKYENNIASIISRVNTIRSSVANIVTNQTTTKLEQILEKTLNWALVGSKYSLINLS